MKKMILAAAMITGSLFGVSALASDYFKVYPTFEEAQANCDYPDWVTAAYNQHMQLIGYMCTHSPDEGGM